MKLTEWYPPHIKPAYVGYYQLSRSGSGGRELGFQGIPQWWDGNQWCHGVDPLWPLCFQNREWRGMEKEE
jgi:hypothetical protein